MTPFRGKLRVRHLEVVLAIADLGNVSKAADQLFLTQSGMSRALTEVEEIVRGKLFERSAKGMVPTQLGATMCRHAALLLSDFRKAEADLASVAGGGAGSLRIGCFSMFARWPIAEAIVHFRMNYPSVEVSVDVGPHEGLVDKLDAGAVDLLISRKLYAQSTYRSVDLVENGVVLACAPSHPLATADCATLADCVAYPWISAPPGSRMREILTLEIDGAGLPMPDIVGALSLELGRELVLAGPYLWHLPASTGRHLAAQGEIVLLPVSFAMRLGTLAAIWRRDRSSTRASRAFILALRNVAQGAAAQ